eukprot:g16020.t2
MGAQYSTGTVSPDWKGWLEDRCSLEHVRTLYNDFRELLSKRREDDTFFITHRDFLEVFAQVGGFPPPGQGVRRSTSNSLIPERKRLRPSDAERHRRMHLDRCFACFDVLERGRVPSGVVWGGIALLTGAPDLAKVKFILSMYDADRDGMVNETELRMAMSACATGFCRLHRIEPPPDRTFHTLAKEAFLHQAVVAEALTPRKTDGRREKLGDTDDASSTFSGRTASISTTSAPASGGGSVGTGRSRETAGNGGGIAVLPAIPAMAVSAFCIANSRCRNFMKGVGAAGSADLVLLYRHEHELLRELAEVDSALDDHDRRAEYAATVSTAYATERGGDARRLVVAPSRVRTLAEKWGIGRILEPAAIRALLDQNAGDGGQSSIGVYGQDDGSPFSAASEKKETNEPNYSETALASPSRSKCGGGRRISWETPLASPDPVESPRASVGKSVISNVNSGSNSKFAADAEAGVGAGSSGYKREPPKSATALGWSDGFESLPEVQMQALVEVAKLVRAAARKKKGVYQADECGMAGAADEDARALEAQTERRAARRAQHDKAMKQRAREAAASLRRAEGGVSKTADSAKFARDYALEIAKRVKNSHGNVLEGQQATGGRMHLAALARGGEGRASLSGGEIRSVGDWEVLKEKHAAASDIHGTSCTPMAGGAESDSQWTAPFATRLDLDTLEDLVEGAGGFVTDREAKEALADGGDLEKDQLGRVTLLGFIRWCRLREKRRLEAEEMRRNPPPPWTQRLRHWRKSWNEGGIQELARVKRRMLGRNTRLTRARRATRVSVGDDDAGSLASSADSSLRGRVYSDIGAGAADSRFGGKKKDAGGGGSQVRESRDGNRTTFSAEPRFSRFALSLSIPRPKQHSGLTSADVVDSARNGEAGGDSNKEASGNSNETRKASSNNNRGGGGGGYARKSSIDKKTRHSSPGTPAVAAEASVASGSKLRLDIVRADADRNAGLSPRSPRPGAEGGGSGPGGTAAAPARFDSAARELLQGYEDEQKKKHVAFWQEQGVARKEREKKAKAEGRPKKEREAVEAEEGRKAAKMAPQVKEMHAVVWLDMPFTAVTLPPPSFAEPQSRSRSRETSAATQRSARKTSTATAAATSDGVPRRTDVYTATHSRTSRDDRGSLVSPPSSIETAGGGSGSGSGQTSLLAALAAERDAAMEREATEASAAERVAREFRGLFDNIPRDYRDEFGFKDVLVTVVRVRYRGGPGTGGGTTPRSPRPSSNTKAVAGQLLSGAKVSPRGGNVSPRRGVSPTGRGGRRVLRVAFFWDRDPFEMSSTNGEGDTESEGNSSTTYHPLAELVSKLTVQLEMTASMEEVLESMEPWKNFKRRLYGPQEEELPRDAVDPRSYARMVLEDIESTSRLLEQVSKMGFDSLRPVLADHGLSEVGTLAELKARASKALEGRIKASAAGGGLSRFGERAARMLFRMADKDQDGGLNFSEMLGMLRRMGMRGTQNAMATELDYIRALKEMGVKTDRNGFLSEDGLVAFYREFGGLADDVEATGVASIDALLGLKLSAVGHIDASAAKRLEDATMEQHPLLGRAEKALSFLLRFAGDAHLDCSGESIADWLTPAADGDERLKEWLLQPGWFPRAVERMQQWLADGNEGVIPSFRDAAAAALGERWASTPPGWFEPGGDNPYFVNDNDRSRGSSFNDDVARDVTTPPTPRRALVETSNADGAKAVGHGEASVAPHPDPPKRDEGHGDGGERSSSAGAARESRTGSKKRPYTTERNNAKELARYLGVSGPDNDNGRGGTGDARGGKKRGAGGGAQEVMGERDEKDGEGGICEERDYSDLEDIIVEAGAVKDMEAALEKARALRAMLASGLPSKIEAISKKELEAAEDKARGINERLQAATAVAVARGLRAYDAARSRLEGVATVGLGTRKITARLQVTGFPIFSLLPAGMGEPMVGRFEEEAREARAEMRRRVALDEIDRAKERQRLEKEERERKRLEKMRLKEEEKMKEEIDLYDRGLSARQMAATRESEKAEAERYWRRLVAIRQRRRRGTPGAAVAVNNLGVLLVEQSERDSVHSAEGRKLLKAAVEMADAGLKKFILDRTTKTGDGGESSGRDSTNDNKGNNAKSSNSSQEGEFTKADSANEVVEPQVAGSGASAAAVAAEASKEGLSVAGGRQEWEVLLALFSSNLCFATEGPGRNIDHFDSIDDHEEKREEGESVKGKGDETQDRLKPHEEKNQDRRTGNTGEGEKKMLERCKAQFNNLSPAAMLACSGPSDSWECLGIGVTLFERENPFWWERDHPEDDEMRQRARAQNELKQSRSRRRLEGLEREYDGTRRKAMVRNRKGTDAECRGGYTDLEVLEVINPGKAARIRLRQARQKAQHERRIVLEERRKQCQRQLRLQEKEAAEARAISAQAREAYREQEAASRRLKEAADGKKRRRNTGRFVRAAGAVKALRARTFGGEGASIGFTASRLAKSLVDKINGWDAARDGDDLSDRVAGGGHKEPPAEQPVAEAAATRAAARAAVRQGAVERAKSGGRGGKKIAKIPPV